MDAEPLTFPLETERLTLRPYQQSDLENLMAYHVLPQVALFLLNSPWDKNFALEQLAKRLPRRGLETPSAALSLIVEVKNQVIGDVVLWTTNDDRTVAELGWSFNPDFHGNGYATEAARKLIEIGFDHYGLHRIIAQLDVRNTASAKVCQRLGMVREAHLREDLWSKGEWTDTYIYALLDTDPRS